MAPRRLSTPRRGKKQTCVAVHSYSISVLAHGYLAPSRCRSEMSLPALSIRLKLPLLISALLLAVTGSFSLAAYGEARKAAVAAASERLRTVTQQLARLLTLSAIRLPATAAATAASSP